MNPAALTAALKSADDAHTALVSKAASLAGKPLEHDAWLLAGVAHKQAANLRMLLATAERRTT